MQQTVKGVIRVRIPTEHVELSRPLPADPDIISNLDEWRTVLHQAQGAYDA